MPQRVTSIQVTAVGASGAKPVGGPLPGAGAVVSGTVEVNEDSLLYIDVGGPGTINGGGFNGGGATTGGGGGGGGATDVRTGSGLPATRLIVAGGGGGSGTNGTCAVGPASPPGGTGGNAGLLVSATAGGDASLCSDATGTGTIATHGGGGATITAGVGAGGTAGATTVTGASNGAVGTLGVGGAGGASITGAGAGGGGGGWYGGGGGASSSTTGPATDTEAAAGGGGGTSLVPLGGSASLATWGTPGSVTIVYNVLPPLADLAVTMRGTHSETGGARFTETITVTNNGPGPSFIETTSVNMPGHLTLFSAPHSTVSHGRLHWSESLIASGASVTYKITFRAWPRFAGNVTFTATAAEDGSVDPNTTDNSYSLTVHVKHPAHWHGRPLA